MKFCVIIPCYNHSESLNGVLDRIGENLHSIIVDDGSDMPVCIGDRKATLLRHSKNLGKAQALKAGFAQARKEGYTHVITIDADGQHPPKYLPKIIDASLCNPDKIIIAARNFDNSNIPFRRKAMNKFSNFWFRVETGKIVNDTQCGFRCYPLDVLEKLDLRLGGFVFEVELLVKAAWSGVDFFEVPIPAVYSKEILSKSHYRPFLDTMRFSAMNTRLFFASLFLSKSQLKKISEKK